MITRDTLEVLQPAPSIFCYCSDCDARYSADSSEWWEYNDDEQLVCWQCRQPIILATEVVTIATVAE